MREAAPASRVLKGALLAIAAWYALRAAATLLHAGDAFAAVTLPPIPNEDGRGWSSQFPFQDARQALQSLATGLAILGLVPLVFLVVHGVRSGNAPQRTAALLSFALVDVFLLMLLWQERAYAAGLPPAPPHPWDDLMGPALLGAFAVLAWPAARSAATAGWLLVAVPGFVPWWDYHLGAFTPYLRPILLVVVTLGYGLLVWAFLRSAGIRWPKRGAAGDPALGSAEPGPTTNPTMTR